MTVHKIVLNCLIPSVTETEFPLYDIKQSSDENNKIYIIYIKYISLYIYSCSYPSPEELSKKS